MTFQCILQTSAKKTSKWFPHRRTLISRLKSWLSKIGHRPWVKSSGLRVLCPTSVERRVHWKSGSMFRFSTEIFSSPCVQTTRYKLFFKDIFYLKKIQLLNTHISHFFLFKWEVCALFLKLTYLKKIIQIMVQYNGEYKNFYSKW